MFSKLLMFLLIATLTVAILARSTDGESSRRAKRCEAKSNENTDEIIAPLPAEDGSSAAAIKQQFLANMMGGQGNKKKGKKGQTFDWASIIVNRPPKTE